MPWNQEDVFINIFLLVGFCVFFLLTMIQHIFFFFTMDFYVKEVIYFKATEVDEKEVCRLCNFFDEKIKAIKGKYVYASSFSHSLFTAHF